MSEIPTVKLSNGLEMPVLGLGTWRGSLDISLIQSVKDGIDIGYRLFDCSQIKGKQQQIGQAIQQKISEGVVKREDLFITSTIWCTSYQPDAVEQTLRTTLKNLQLNFLDLFLVDCPQSCLKDSNADYGPIWRDMEMVYKKNLTNAIGVSNLNSKQTERILNVCTIHPQVNQIECHPYLNQLKLRKYCINNGIIIMASNPLAEHTNPGKPGDFDGFSDDRIAKIATRYQKTSSQILLKYNCQLGNVMVSEFSSNKRKAQEDMKIFDFYLAPEDMSYINTFSCSEVNNNNITK